MADIVKLIYKGDEMAQWWGSGSSNVEVLPMVTTSDTTWAQAILDAALDWKFVILKYKDSSTTKNSNFYFMDNMWDSTTASWAFIRFRRTWIYTASWSTQEHVAGTQTWYYIKSEVIFIRYNWTTVTSVDKSNAEGEEIWISWYTDPQ